MYIVLRIGWSSRFLLSFFVLSTAPPNVRYSLSSSLAYVSLVFSQYHSHSSLVSFSLVYDLCSWFILQAPHMSITSTQWLTHELNHLPNNHLPNIHPPTHKRTNLHIKTPHQLYTTALFKTSFSHLHPLHYSLTNTPTTYTLPLYPRSTGAVTTCGVVFLSSMHGCISLSLSVHFCMRVLVIDTEPFVECVLCRWHAHFMCVAWLSPEFCAGKIAQADWPIGVWNYGLMSLKWRMHACDKTRSRVTCRYVGTRRCE